MLLFSFPAYENIAQQLREVASVPAGRFAVGRYDNRELHARIEGPVSGEHCLLLGTIAPPDECLLSVTLLAETLKKEGAEKITAVFPYLAYSRQDKNKPGESLGTQLKSLRFNRPRVARRILPERPPARNGDPRHGAFSTSRYIVQETGR